MPARRTALVAALVAIIAVSGLAVALDRAEDDGRVATAGTESDATSTAPTAGAPSDDPTTTRAEGAAERTTDGAASSPAPASSAASTIDPDAPDLEDRGPHPALEDIDGWLQSDVTSLEELRGNVVAVQFWTFGCHNCQATLPHMRALRDRYAGQDFEIVGIHSPELSHEEDPDDVVAAAADLGVTWPIALDTSKRTFFGWQGGRGYWPHIYLLDRDGHVRYDHIGEGRYDEIDAAVGALLAESG